MLYVAPRKISKSERKITMTIGEKIKKTREAKGMSIKVLSALSGIDANLLEKYENGEVKPHYATRLKLSDVLDEDVTTVYGEVLDKAYDVSAAQEACKSDGENNTAAIFSAALATLLEADETAKDDLAAAVGLTVYEIDEFLSEMCLPDVATLAKIADYFSVTTDLLLGKSFLSEREKTFLDFLYQIEALTDLNRSGAIPDDLYILCRDAVVANYI